MLLEVQANALSMSSLAQRNNTVSSQITFQPGKKGIIVKSC